MTDNQYPPSHPLHRATKADLDQLAALDLTLANAPHREAYAIRRVVDGELGRVTYVPWAEADAVDDTVGYIIRKWHEAQQLEQPAPQLTPEQRFHAAHRRLTDAIDDVVKAAQDAEGDNVPALLVDWVVVTASHADHGNGITSASHGIYGPQDGPAYRTIGLLEWAAWNLKTSLNGGDPD